jgi:hypothetical protein
LVDPASVREGVKWLPDVSCELLFVTLQKSEQHERPMGITWRLRQPTPEDLFVETGAVVAAG